MECRKARASFVEWELSLLPPDAERAILAHLETCSECAALARSERVLSAGLLRLRVETPFQVDVAARVMVEISRLGRPAPPRVPARHFGWASAAAVLVASVLLGIAGASLPEVRQALVAGLLAVLDLGQAMGTAVSPLAPYVQAMGRILLTLGRAAGDLLAATTHLEPLARPAVVFSAMAALALSSLVIGRDLVARSPRATAKELP